MEHERREQERMEHERREQERMEHERMEHERREQERSHECVVCIERNKCIVLMPCKHLCVCELCASTCSGRCPICRAVIESEMRVYS